MDSWQEEVLEKLQEFTKSFPPGRNVTEGETEVLISINAKEAYVLQNIVEQWVEENKNKP